MLNIPLRRKNSPSEAPFAPATARKLTPVSERASGVEEGRGGELAAKAKAGRRKKSSERKKEEAICREGGVKFPVSERNRPKLVDAFEGGSGAGFGQQWLTEKRRKQCRTKEESHCSRACTFKGTEGHSHPPNQRVVLDRHMVIHDLQLSYRLTNDNLRNAMIRCIGEMNAVPMHGVSRARAYVSAVGSARRFPENFQESAFVVGVNDHNALAGDFAIEYRQSASQKAVVIGTESVEGFQASKAVEIGGVGGGELRRQASERERAGNQDPLCSELDDPFNSVNNCGDDVRDESSNLFNRPSLAEEGEIVVPAKFSEDEKRIFEAIRARSGGLEGRFEMILEPLQLLADRRFGIGGANVSVEERELESGGDEVDDEATVGEPTCGLMEEGFAMRLKGGRGGELVAKAKGKRMKAVRRNEE
nr:hypothetical protein Iba_chr11eCG4590 [Ipomoea batatas]